MPDGIESQPVPLFYTTRDVFERLELHSRENLISFSELHTAMNDMRLLLASLTEKFQPVSELRVQIHGLEDRAALNAKRLDIIAAENQSRTGVGRTALSLLTGASTTLAILLTVWHFIGH